jgi:hypothetical protein
MQAGVGQAVQHGMSDLALHVEEYGERRGGVFGFSVTAAWALDILLLGIGMPRGHQVKILSIKNISIMREIYVLNCSSRYLASTAGDAGEYTIL